MEFLDIVARLRGNHASKVTDIVELRDYVRQCVGQLASHTKALVDSLRRSDSERSLPPHLEEPPLLIPGTPSQGTLTDEASPATLSKPAPLDTPLPATVPAPVPTQLPDVWPRQAGVEADLARKAELRPVLLDRLGLALALLRPPRAGVSAAPGGAARRRAGVVGAAPGRGRRDQARP